MLGLLISPNSEIKSYVAVLPFYRKMMKRRTFQACNFKAYHQKWHVFCLGKTGLVLVGQGGVLPNPPSWLRASAFWRITNLLDD